MEEALAREDFFRILGVVTRGPKIDKYTEKAYDDLEKEIWKEDLESSPHGRPWHTSFHASSFPGHEKVCGRAAIYNLLDIPPAGPMPARLRAVAEMGKAAENQIVYRWAKAGLLLGGPYDDLKDGDDIEQVGFADPETWLTGSSDAIMDLRPEWDSVLPVDVKSKSYEVIQSMKIGRVSYDLKHYMQLQGYIYLCNVFHEEKGWADLGLKPAKGGVIYYVARDNPRFTKEFYVEANWTFIDSAINRMTEWKQMYLDEELPERNPDWKWTEEPCKWCPLKRDSCKPDYKAGVKKLRESKSLAFAKRIRPSYDYEKKREEVLRRWNQSEPEQSSV